MYKITKRRKAIQELFEHATSPLSAPEVHVSLQKGFRKLGMATVYRIIKLLTEEGILKRINLPAEIPRFEFAKKPHHHHFRCTVCGKIFEIFGCTENLNKILPDGFRLKTYELTLYGECSECKS